MKTKKELKVAYKLTKSQMGVFQIRNKVNGKVLIDSSADIKAKQNRHKAELKFGNHRNKELQEDWKNFGADIFVFEVLTELEPKEETYSNYSLEIKHLLEVVIEDLKLSKDTQY